MEPRDASVDEPNPREWELEHHQDPDFIYVKDVVSGRGPQEAFSWDLGGQERERDPAW